MRRMYSEEQIKKLTASEQVKLKHVRKPTDEHWEAHVDRGFDLSSFDFEMLTYGNDRVISVSTPIRVYYEPDQMGGYVNTFQSSNFLIDDETGKHVNACLLIGLTIDDESDPESGASFWISLEEADTGNAIYIADATYAGTIRCWVRRG